MPEDVLLRRGCVRVGRRLSSFSGGVEGELDS